MCAHGMLNIAKALIVQTYDFSKRVMKYVLKIFKVQPLAYEVNLAGDDRIPVEFTLI